MISFFRFFLAQIRINSSKFFKIMSPGKDLMISKILFWGSPSLPLAPLKLLSTETKKNKFDYFLSIHQYKIEKNFILRKIEYGKGCYVAQWLMQMSIECKEVGSLKIAFLEI